MTFRKANPADFPKILELQKLNLLQNLEPQDQKAGFLSIEYSAEELALLNQELGIFVALKDDHLAGFLINQTMEFAVQSPLITAMVKRFSEVQYNGRPLSSFRTFIYGPVCVDRKQRGRGILEGLYDVMLKTLQGQYDVGVAFVSDNNPRSFYAHRDKLGMNVVDEFRFNDQKYSTLVFWAGASGTEFR
jgi:predicted GNAT superfamily acetyltransferase